MTSEDAQRTLATLDSGALDAYLTPSARDRLRADALRALDGPPIARVVAVTRSRQGVRTVVIACPFCPPTPRGKPRTHIHGWPDDQPQPGMRNAHCDGAAGSGYRIELADVAVAS
jgi:hypothetical protein